MKALRLFIEDLLQSEKEAKKEEKKEKAILGWDADGFDKLWLILLWAKKHYLFWAFLKKEFSAENFQIVFLRLEIIVKM